MVPEHSYAFYGVLPDSSMKSEKVPVMLGLAAHCCTNDGLCIPEENLAPITQCRWMAAEL